MPSGPKAPEYNRRYRRKFIAEKGFSTRANLATGGNRVAVLERDGYACVKCGMTDEEHKQRWNRPITVDHISKDRSDNRLENLQTLCLRCHGRKDISPQLVVPQVPAKKDEVLRLRAEGKTYEQIAQATGFSVGAIWKWVRRWTKEETE